MFQELINRWVNVNRSHYAGVDRSGHSENSKTRTKNAVNIIIEEEGTAITSASSAMTPASNNPSSIGLSTHANSIQSRTKSRSTRTGKAHSSFERGLPQSFSHSQDLLYPRPLSQMHGTDYDAKKPSKSRQAGKKSKSKRGLRRTHSQSDLLLSKFDESEKQSTKNTNNKPNQAQPHSSKTNDIHPKFPQELKIKDHQTHHEALNKSKERYLNEATFSQQWQQNQHNQYNSPTRRGCQGLSSMSTIPSNNRHRIDVKKKDHLTGMPQTSVLGKPNAEIHARPSHNEHFPEEVNNNQSTADMHNNHDHSEPNVPCQACLEMEKKLRMMESDIEYLRSLSLNEENICSSCRTHPTSDIFTFHNHHQSTLSSSQSSSSFSTSHSSKKKSHFHSGPNTNGTVATLSTISMSQSSAFPHSHIGNHHNDLLAGDKMRESKPLMEASQRLVDVTVRHQQQIEQMTRERARWQNDLHLKLSKFALLCKELNEESAKRKQDYVTAQEELTHIKHQYSDMAMEVQMLRAKVSLHEQEALENDKIRESLITRDNDLMDKADAAIKKRDSVISELSGKLEMTMDTLELERYQQRQRRQIIFPVSRQHQMPMQDVIHGNDENTSLVKTLNDQLHQAKQAARLAEESLKDSHEKALQREEELQRKCEDLAEQLEEAKTAHRQ